MKETAFIVAFRIKTTHGFECFGKFFLGHDRRFSQMLFKKLKGSKNIDEKTVLQMDLMEMKNGLPVNLDVMGCTLEELTDNCRIITKDAFKFYNLEA